MTRFLLFSFAVLSLAACRKGSSADQVTVDLGSKPKGTPVATFRGGAVTVEQVNHSVGNLPPMLRMRLQGAEARKEYVESLARNELLAQEGIRQGLQNDPEVVETLKRAIAQRVLTKALDAAAVQPSDEDVKAWYVAHLADYHRPATVQVQDIFLSTEGADDARRKARASEAEKLRTRARALKPEDEKGFAELAKASSDDALSKAVGGDLGAMPIPDLQARHGTEVAQAARALETVGAISPVIATPKGFHVLRMKGRTPERTQSLQEAQPQIRSKLFSERRTTAINTLVNRLKSEADYKLDEAALTQISTPPTTVPGMPHPGMGPGGMPGAGPPRPPMGAAPPGSVPPPSR